MYTIKGRKTNNDRKIHGVIFWAIYIQLKAKSQHKCCLEQQQLIALQINFVSFDFELHYYYNMVEMLYLILINSKPYARIIEAQVCFGQGLGERVVCTKVVQRNLQNKETVRYELWR